MTDEIMMHGLIMLDLRREHHDVKEEGATSDELDAAVGRVREVYERAVAQVQVVKNIIGDDIYSCGWIMLHFRKLRQRIIPGHDGSTKQQFLLCPTSNSLLRNCGLCLRNLRLGVLSWCQVVRY